MFDNVVGVECNELPLKLHYSNCSISHLQVNARYLAKKTRITEYNTEIGDYKIRAYNVGRKFVHMIHDLKTQRPAPEQIEQRLKELQAKGYLMEERIELSRSPKLKFHKLIIYCT